MPKRRRPRLAIEGGSPQLAGARQKVEGVDAVVEHSLLLAGRRTVGGQMLKVEAALRWAR
jgi:hypothetical protein